MKVFDGGRGGNRWQQTNKQSHQANCLTQDGNIAVSDYDNKWISVHEPNGKFVSKVIFRLDLSSAEILRQT